MPASQILVIDDDEATRYVLTEALSDEGYIVNAVPHGAAALAALEAFCPDLIVLDSRMPVMDGHDFLDVYRRRPGHHVPTIGLSGDTGDLPADTMLAKPFDLGELINVVQQYLATASLPAGS